MSNSFSFKRMIAYAKTMLFNGTFKAMLISGLFFGVWVGFCVATVHGVFGGSDLNIFTFGLFVMLPLVSHVDLLTKSSLALTVPVSFAEKYVARLVVVVARLLLVFAFVALGVMLSCLLGLGRVCPFSASAAVMVAGRLIMAFSVALFIGVCSVSFRSALAFWLTVVPVIAFAFVVGEFPDAVWSLVVYVVISIVANVLAVRFSRSATINSVNVLGPLYKPA